MTDKPSIAQALAAVMEDVRAVGKGDRNTQQNYNFRGIDAVVNAAGPALRKHGVVVMPMVEAINYRDVQTSTGKASRECTVTVRYRFHGPAGDFLDCVTPGESMDFGDKGAPKAMSVAFRIALLQALCLPTTDTDPDSQQYERGSAPSQQERSGPPQQRSSGQQRPAQPQPSAPAAPAADKAVKAAVDMLRRKCATHGYQWDLVVAKFPERYEGQQLAECTDTNRIIAFSKLLESYPSQELGAPDPSSASRVAANGAQAR